jgi:PAS domain S-box-containing protein
MPPEDWLVLAVGLADPLSLACVARLGGARFDVRLARRAADARASAAARQPQAVLIGPNLVDGEPATLAGCLKRELPGSGSALMVYLAGEADPDCDRAPFDIWLPHAAPDPAAEAITDLLRVARAQASDGRLCGRLIDSAPDPILTVDASGRIVLVNAQTEAVFGYHRRDLLGRPVERLVPVRLAEGHVGHRQEYWSAPRTRAMGQQRTLFARHRDGHEFPVEISLAPLEVDGERFVTAAVRDVSVHRQMERELRESREWLDAILAATSDGVLVEADERIVFVNRALVQLCGYESAEELLGRPVSAIYAADDRDRLLADTRCRRAGEPAPTVYEFAGLRKDGSQVPLEASVAVRPIGGRLSTVAAIRDISERKRAELERARLAAAQAARDRADAARERVAGLYRAAREANRLKDDFLTTLSHELRTPLNVILGWARLLRGKRVDAETRQRALDSVERNSQLLADLASQLLDVSRIVTGKLRLERRPTDLAALMVSAIDSIRPAAEAKGVALGLHLQPGLRPLFADGNRLLQVLWNLLSNAVKFTSAGGRIDVTLGDSTSGVRLCVADTGAGIPPEFLPFVFDRFRQGVDPHTASHGGLGLGLSIVRDLVEAHGGTVTVESPGEGLGTSFTVALPRGETPATLASPGAAGTTEAHQALAGLRILAVDNDEDSRTLLAAALHQQGASVVVAGSTSEAVDALGRLRFDGVVADIAVPGEDRRALIEQIRAAPEGRPLPAVAVTAGARIEDEAAALAAGFHGCLPKPFAPEELAEMLASMVSHGVE